MWQRFPVTRAVLALMALRLPAVLGSGSQPGRPLCTSSWQAPWLWVLTSAALSSPSLMFWTNWNEQHPSIMRAALSGANVLTLIEKDIRTPNGLAIDHRAEKLYFSDATLDKIERCEYDGSHRYVSLRARRDGRHQGASVRGQPGSRVRAAQAQGGEREAAWRGGKSQEDNEES